MSAMKTMLRALCRGALCWAAATPALAADEPPAVFVAEVRVDEFVDRIEALGTL